MVAVLQWCLLLALVLSFNAMAGCTTAATMPKPFFTKTSRTSQCPLDIVNNSLAHWASPNFGETDYPNSVTCYLWKRAAGPFWLRVTFNAFYLEDYNADGDCNDYVRIITPAYFPNYEFCGEQTGTIVDLPSCNFDAIFEADGSETRSGFNITVSRETSNCHELIETPAIIGRSGIIKPPKEYNNIWEKKACEWWIRSPSGTKIQLEFLQVKLSSDCQESSVIVNPAGDNLYPIASSERHCGVEEPAPVVSDDNEIDVLFFAKNDLDFFRAKWTVVEA